MTHDRDESNAGALVPQDLGADRDPEIDSDSRKRLGEEHPDAPHAASRFDAGTGQGTVQGPPHTAHQDRPVLDGSTESAAAEASVPNPYRGQSDPGTVTHQPALTTTGTKRWLIASCVAAVVVTLVLLPLMRWSPVWSGIGIIVALVSLLLMILVRESGMPLPVRLKTEAVLMALLWLVPLAIIITVLVTTADDIV